MHLARVGRIEYLRMLRFSRNAPVLQLSYG